MLAVIGVGHKEQLAWGGGLDVCVREIHTGVEGETTILAVYS